MCDLLERFSRTAESRPKPETVKCAHCGKPIPSVEVVRDIRTDDLPFHEACLGPNPPPADWSDIY